MKDGVVIPRVTFKIREGDEKPSDKSMGGCPIGGLWKDVTTDEPIREGSAKDALGFVGDQPRVRVDFESHRGSRKQSETDENAPVYGRADAVFPGRG